MKVTFIIKKAAKRYDTESTATIYIRLRNGRQLDSVAPTQLSINPNLWDDKAECVKTKAVCNEDLRTGINEEIRKLKTYVEKSFHTEKESVDKEWLKLTLDRYYHPEKYFTPEEIANRPEIGPYDKPRQTHINDITPRNFVEVCVDLKQQGLAGYDSWYSRPEPEYTLPADREYKWGFTLIPGAKANSAQKKAGYSYK